MTLRHEMEERFEISFGWRVSVPCASISGRLDERAPDRFTQKTDMAISEAVRVLDAVILDCSALGYISELGWNHVLRLAHELHGRGIRVSIAEPPAELYDVLGQADCLDSLKMHLTLSAWLRVGNVQDHMTLHRSIHAQRPRTTGWGTHEPATP